MVSIEGQQFTKCTVGSFNSNQNSKKAFHAWSSLIWSFILSPSSQSLVISQIFQSQGGGKESAGVSVSSEFGEPCHLVRWLVSFSQEVIAHSIAYKTIAWALCLTTCFPWLSALYRYNWKENINDLHSSVFEASTHQHNDMTKCLNSLSEFYRFSGLG